MQEGFIEGCVAGKTDLAQAIARATFVDELDIGHARHRVDRQALAYKVSAEETIARCLVLDQALGIFVVTVVKHLA
ncbi:hypothetical protein D9M71_811930 [compost metagenome]